MADGDATVRTIAWAAEAGRFAVEGFAVVLAVVLAIVAVAGWRIGRAVQRRQGASPHSPKLLLLSVAAIGFAVILLAAALFAELAEGIGSGGTIGRADAAFSAQLQRDTSSAVVRTFHAITRLGDGPVLTTISIGVAAVLVWIRRWQLALAWAVTVGGNGILNWALKRIFARVRPLHEGGLETASGFSFPSGHASGAVVTYGMLAYLALRLLPPRWHVPALLAATALALSVGSSRVFLRVHYSSDVLAGFASGSAWLAVCIAAIEIARRRRGYRR